MQEEKENGHERITESGIIYTILLPRSRLDFKIFITKARYSAVFLNFSSNAIKCVTEDNIIFIQTLTNGYEIAIIITEYDRKGEK